MSYVDLVLWKIGACLTYAQLTEKLMFTSKRQVGVRRQA